MIIAIDGPAAAGKGTLARRIAERFGLAHLDTGHLYRAVAVRLRRAGGNGADRAAATAAAKAIEPGDLNDPLLREEATGRLASEIAAVPEVRAALLDYQRRFAARPPGDAAGAVLDGRDIGTVVCPGADVKLFVTASLEERTRRRSHEIIARGTAADSVAVRAHIKARDDRDAARATAPLKPAPDARLLDTTNLDIDSAFAAAESLILERIG